MELNDKQRERLVQDIVDQQEQIESVSNAYIRTIRNMSNDGLENEWRATVGRWLLSRDDISIPSDLSEDEWLDNIVNKVARGEDVPYGFS